MDAATRGLVRARAANRCEYCRIHEDDEPFAFHLEHIFARKHDGDDNPANLAWSCQHRNFAKGPNPSGRIRNEIVPLFHPRRQRWTRHFRWDGPVLVGKTKYGKVTIRVLDINKKDRCRLREILIAVGAFPPP